MSKIGWFGSDEDGNVVSKTEIRDDVLFINTIILNLMIFKLDTDM